MINQTRLSILTIKNEIWKQIWLKVLNFVEDLKNTSNLIKNLLRQAPEKNHTSPTYWILACKNQCNQPTSGLLNA